MIGWHYTGAQNWRKIRQEGLVPYLIDHPSVVGLGLGPVWGIWTWPRPQEGHQHLGNLLFQMVARGESCLVKLEIQYDRADLWADPSGKIIQLKHQGSMSVSRWSPRTGGSVMVNELAYHDDEPSEILGRLVPPERIRLVGEYDLLALTGAYDVGPHDEAHAAAAAACQQLELHA